MNQGSKHEYRVQLHPTLTNILFQDQTMVKILLHYIKRSELINNNLHTSGDLQLVNVRGKGSSLGGWGTGEKRLFIVKIHFVSLPGVEGLCHDWIPQI